MLCCAILIDFLCCAWAVLSMEVQVLCKRSMRSPHVCMVPAPASVAPSLLVPRHHFWFHISILLLYFSFSPFCSLGHVPQLWSHTSVLFQPSVLLPYLDFCSVLQCWFLWPICIEGGGVGGSRGAGAPLWFQAPVRPGASGLMMCFCLLVTAFTSAWWQVCFVLVCSRWVL